MPESTTVATQYASDGSRTWTLVVSKDFDTLAVQVGGEMPNIDEGIAMLQQAIRSLEHQQRLQAVRQAQAQLHEQAEASALARQIRDTVNHR